MGRRADQLDQRCLEILASIDEDDDPRATLAELKKRIEQYREAGDEVPEQLVIAERQLVTELIAQSQGR